MALACGARRRLALVHWGWRWPWPFPRPHPGGGGGGGGAIPTRPVLLVPGIGGSILNAAADDGREERIWVRLFNADAVFRRKLWSKYNPRTGKSESLDDKTVIRVPQDNYGLYSCSNLDPDVRIPLDALCYYQHLILEMKKWGYKEGETLFGFGYDFRQSNRLEETMLALLAKLEEMHQVSGGKKVDIITHSMGGLLLKSFLVLHKEAFEKYVHTWITIASPFRGAPGFITDSLLTGVEFVKGWQKDLFVAKWSLHQLLVECPSVYEMLADDDFEWAIPPELRICRKEWCQGGDEDGAKGATGKVTIERHGPGRALHVMAEALKKNVLKLDGRELPLPLNPQIVEWACETREQLKSARLPKSCKFYNIHGHSIDTAFHTRYGSPDNPIEDMEDILHTEAVFEYVDGDGTVPVESAKADGLEATCRIGVSGEHRGVLRDKRVFRVLQHWLEVGGYEADYDPQTDCVLVASRAEIEESMTGSVIYTHPVEEKAVEIEISQPRLEELGNDSRSSRVTVAITTGNWDEGVGPMAEVHAEAQALRPQPGEAAVEFEVSATGVAQASGRDQADEVLGSAMQAATQKAIMSAKRREQKGLAILSEDGHI
eukprot:SM000025S08319  [mRNA]  locus=s25:51672:55202:+ [translate_table: standard]